MPKRLSEEAVDRYRRDGYIFPLRLLDDGEVAANRTRLEAFEAEAAAANLTASQYALKWMLDRPGLTACVVGAKRIDQIEALVPGCQ